MCCGPRATVVTVSETKASLGDRVPLAPVEPALKDLGRRRGCYMHHIGRFAPVWPHHQTGLFRLLRGAGMAVPSASQRLAVSGTAAGKAVWRNAPSRPQAGLTVDFSTVWVGKRTRVGATGPAFVHLTTLEGANLPSTHSWRRRCAFCHPSPPMENSEEPQTETSATTIERTLTKCLDGKRRRRQQWVIASHSFWSWGR